MERGAGILLPITSLPSRFGIGCFSKEAYYFIDWLSDAHQKYWQILPLSHTGYGDSPYQAFSSFAGNPYMVDLEELIMEGVIDEEDCKELENGDSKYIDYKKQYDNRFRILRKAFLNSRPDDDFYEFCDNNSDWLCDYALFMAIKEYHGGYEWQSWDKSLRQRDSRSLAEYGKKLKGEAEFFKYIQYKFYSQWHKLKAYANSKGVKIIGDIPIYTAMDSADVWAKRELFCVDKDGGADFVAGCPPDAFSKGGQLWGNPLYDWSYHRRTGYEWWIKRLRFCFSIYDIVRIDHFRGFDEFYAVPSSDTDARRGHWEKGPGISLFKRVKEAIGDREIIAEDLGFITDSVRELVRDTGFSGMKVLEFAFDKRDSSKKSDYLPHNYIKKAAAYTATHDNETLISWFLKIDDDERKRVREYLFDTVTPDNKINLPLIALIMRSNADLCIVPIQDWLGLDDGARINTPSTLGNNWRWRLSEGELGNELLKTVRKMTDTFGR